MHCEDEIDLSEIDAATDTSALRMAIESGNDELATLVVESGASLKAATKKMETPLMLAAGAGLTATVKAMIENGAEMEKSFKGVGGRTAMHFAAKAGHAATVIALAKLGAQSNAVDALGMTPLFLACQEGHVRVVDALMDAIFHKENGSFKSAQLDACILHACIGKNDSNAAEISKNSFTRAQM
jgi:ankyrin repeat protein